MNTWNPIPELIAIPIDTHQYQQNLAELAEILYEYISKLDIRKPIGPELHNETKKEVRYEEK